jgi:Putative redox-active protein (C_GCAxxG_C_C)
VDGTGITDRGLMRPACPLEGGAVSQGSTCGVVSGGCLGLALCHEEELASDDPRKVAALYEQLKDYTRWFEAGFGSTICRQRSGVEFNALPGLADYLFTGKFLTRCVAHVGPAVEYLVERCSRPLESSSATAGGWYCAAPVLRSARDEASAGDLLERVSMALDGGIGLSGGLCGALAGALMLVGSRYGADPRESLFRGTLVPTLEGHINMYRRRERPELWSVGGPLVRSFRKEFGSMECREITGRDFNSAGELEDYMSSSEVCARIQDWLTLRLGSLDRT